MKERTETLIVIYKKIVFTQLLRLFSANYFIIKKIKTNLHNIFIEILTLTYIHCEHKDSPTTPISH